MRTTNQSIKNDEVSQLINLDTIKKYKVKK
jgi:hypothetical protein